MSSYPQIVGVLNITPDSFSDGGLYLDVDCALKRAHEMYNDGALIIDIGGQSSRPGAEPVATDIELARVLPIIERLSTELPTVRISIDTYCPKVAIAACGAGATIINDITGFSNPEMIEAALQAGADCVLLHMAGNPHTMQDNPFYIDVAFEVSEYLMEGAERLTAAGVSAEKIILDPGYGFGKTLDHNLELLLHASELAERVHKAGHKLLIGVSRKSFIGNLFGIEDPVQRDEASAQFAAVFAANGVDYLRVHDVAISLRAIERLMDSRTPAVDAYIALGSNMGGSMGNIANALRHLDALPHTSLEDYAAPVMSEPAYDADQTSFTNTVCRLKTQLEPLALFAYMQAIEVEMGREETRPNGPRIIDLDLLTYGNQVIDLPELQVPHSRMAERAFVVEPLHQIAPNFTLPNGSTLDSRYATHGKIISNLPKAAIESELLRKQEQDR